MEPSKPIRFCRSIYPDRTPLASTACIPKIRNMNHNLLADAPRSASSAFSRFSDSSLMTREKYLKFGLLASPAAFKIAHPESISYGDV